MEIVVYTDGATLANGKKNPRGGIGVYFLYSKEEISLTFPDAARLLMKNVDLQEATNNKCELLAILLAVKRSTEDLEKGSHLWIKSDSNYCINSLTKWYPGWEKKNWMRTGNKPVLNKEIIQEIVKYLKQFPGQIKFKHVPAHTKQPAKTAANYQDWYGNDKADKLAVVATM